MKTEYSDVKPKDWRKKDVVRAICMLIKQAFQISQNEQKIIEVIGKLANADGELLQNDRDIIRSLYTLERRITKLERKCRK